MNITAYIDRLRAKPEHVRQRITLGAAAAMTGVVTLAWVGTLAATGTFALNSKQEDTSGVFAQVTPTAAKSDTNFNELVGAVGAGLGVAQKPELVIEDNGASSTLDRTAPPPSATVLTF